MKWLIVALGCALALAFAMPLSQEAQADGVYRAVRTYSPVVFSRKRCIAPTRDGAQVSWICNASETCCYDRVFRKGSCYPADRRCF